MNIILCIILLAACTAHPSLQTESHKNVKTLKYSNSVGEIVKDLVTNWNSPILYLRNRGYLHEPQKDFDMFRQDMGKADTKNALKSKRSKEYESPNDLNHLFRSLFASNDESVSDKIKSRLGVAWDMDKLKTSVHNKAHKYYEKYYNKRNQLAAKEQAEGQDQEREHELGGDTDLEKQVAQLYPSVVAHHSNEHNVKQQNTESFDTNSNKDTKFLNGIAKLLTNRGHMARIKPLPLQMAESKQS